MYSIYKTIIVYYVVTTIYSMPCCNIICWVDYINIPDISVNLIYMHVCTHSVWFSEFPS